ncbi:MAG TPA: AtpZ/AtpI family protein [Planctomycetota bacterium]|nr:AtpZ/AtpI family protein [Planctomycetota bacterium]
MPTPTPPRGPGDLRLLDLLSVGAVFGTCIAGGYFLGSYLDGRFGTAPWMVVAGVVLGSTLGFLELFRSVRRSLK